MYARVSRITFHPGTADAALQFFQAAILPSARAQPGFHNAFVAHLPGTDHGLIITVWATEAALLASGPPPAIAEALAQWTAYIVEASQEIYAVRNDMPAWSDSDVEG